MNPVIITAAICGAEVTREDTPYLPITAEELADEALKSQEAGASIIHLHVRDADGQPTQDKQTFQNAIEAMKKKGVTAIIQPSTGGAAGMTWQERIQPAYLSPEMATLDCGTLNFGDTIFVNDMPLMRQFLTVMNEHGIRPELECFEPGHISNALRLRDEGLLQGHLHFDIVLGVPGAMKATAKNLMFMTEMLPEGSTWTGAGVGRHQLLINLLSIAMGGHVRVGFEDNIYYTRGQLAEGNAQMVKRIVRLVQDSGREVATPEQAREILSINGGQK